MNLYTVVVRDSAYSFINKDSYLRFCDEVEKKGERPKSFSTGEPFETCEKALWQYEQYCEGERMAAEIDRIMDVYGDMPNTYPDSEEFL